jgi:hypothetical protein
MGQKRSALHRDDHLLEKSAQDFLLVPVGCGGCAPYVPEIAAERQDVLVLFRRQFARAYALAPDKFGLSLFQFT